MKIDGSVVCWGSNEYGQATPPGEYACGHATSERPRLHRRRNSSSQRPPASAASDRAVLVTLYNAVDAPGWVFENWLSDVSLGEWQGVTTDANGRVIELDLGVIPVRR